MFLAWGSGGRRGEACSPAAEASVGAEVIHSGRGLTRQWGRRDGRGQFSGLDNLHHFQR